MATRLTRSAVVAMALAAVAAGCRGSKDQYSSGGAIDTTAMKAPATDTTTPMTPPVVAVVWTTPLIIGFETALDHDEIDLGRLAEKKATSPDVKAFARLMVTQHGGMLAETRKLATKLHTTGDTMSADIKDMTARGQDALKELTEKAAGPDWDKAYMDKMVDGHQAALAKLQDAATTADAQLRPELEQMIAKVQTHLTKAQEVRAKLG